MSKPNPKHLAAALLVTASAVVINACDSESAIVETGDNEPETSAPTLTETSVTGAGDASSTSLMNYTMPAITGGDTRENAVVMIPAGEAPEGGWPVIGWGHGTVGVADACAPSASDTLSNYAPYLNSWLAAGYAIVAPDYEGLGTPGGHPYLHLDSQGRSLNYAVAAATEAFPELSNNYALVGHSQGGHAVLGAASLSAENPEINLVGAVAIAPITQVLAQSDILEGIYTNAGSSDQERVGAAVADLAFSALIVHGIETAFADFDASVFYGDDGQDLQQSVETVCLSDLTTQLAASVPPVLLAQNSVASFIDPSIVEDETVLAYFESVEPGARTLNAPTLLAQGLSDLTVFPDSTIALQSQLSAVSDTDVIPQLETYLGATHTGVLQASFNDAIAFVTSRFTAQ
jgi:pimeloyl-ACP methyl ester carboxylesterase